MLDQMQKDAEQEKVKADAQEMENSIIQQKLAEATPTAENGEKAIQQDDATMAVFSHLLANQMTENPVTRE